MIVWHQPLEASKTLFSTGIQIRDRITFGISHQINRLLLGQQWFYKMNTYIVYINVCLCTGLHEFNSKANSQLKKKRPQINWNRILAWKHCYQKTKHSNMIGIQRLYKQSDVSILAAVQQMGFWFFNYLKLPFTRARNCFPICSNKYISNNIQRPKAFQGSKVKKNSHPSWANCTNVMLFSALQHALFG